jgi:hypothetical protein
MNTPTHTDQYVTQAQLRTAIANLTSQYASQILLLRVAVNKLEEQQMSTQADVEVLTAAIGTVSADLDAAKVKLQAELDALSTANPALDLSGLQAAIAPLDAVAQGLGALVPAPVAPPVPAPVPPVPPVVGP